jgi:hypothetical protein
MAHYVDLEPCDCIGTKRLFVASGPAQQLKHVPVRQRVDIYGALRNLAEIGVAITGFAGIVAAVAFSSSGSWSDSDRGNFRALVIWSLGATFLAYVPIVFASLGDRVPAPWRVANALLAVYHGGIFVQTFMMLRKGEMFRTPSVTLMLSVGGVVLAAEVAAAAGPLSSIAPSVYLIAVLWFLFIAANRFVTMANHHFGRSTA